MLGSKFFSGIAGGALLLASVGSAGAQYAPPGPYAPGGYAPGYGASYQPAREATPDELLEQGIQRTMDFMRQSGGGADLGEILNFIDREIAVYFDFNYMARLAAGPLVREVSDEQLSLVTQRLREMFLSALAQQLASYAFTHHKVTFYPAIRDSRSNDVTVTARITHPRGYPVKVTFRFHATPNGWRVYDVAANNSSAVMFYRRQIAMIAQRYGKDALFRGDACC